MKGTTDATDHAQDALTESGETVQTIYVQYDDGRVQEVPAVLHVRVTAEHIVLEREGAEPMLIPRCTVFFASADHVGAPPCT